MTRSLSHHTGNHRCDHNAFSLVACPLQTNAGVYCILMPAPCIFDLMSKIFIPGLPSLDESHPDYVPSLNLGYRVKSKSARMEEYAKSIERCVKKSLLTDTTNVSSHNIFAGELSIGKWGTTFFI